MMYYNHPTSEGDLIFAQLLSRYHYVKQHGKFSSADLEIAGDIMPGRQTPEAESPR